MKQQNCTNASVIEHRLEAFEAQYQTCVYRRNTSNTLQYYVFSVNHSALRQVSNLPRILFDWVSFFRRWKYAEFVYFSRENVCAFGRHTFYAIKRLVAMLLLDRLNHASDIWLFLGCTNAAVERHQWRQLKWVRSMSIQSTSAKLSISFIHKGRKLICIEKNMYSAFTAISTATNSQITFA